MNRFKSVMAVLGLMVVIAIMACITIFPIEGSIVAMQTWPTPVMIPCTLVVGLCVGRVEGWVFYRPVAWLMDQVFVEKWDKNFK